ncbi:hypothetical protein NMG60_11015999 [Bertholletia excelsa]
MINSKVNNNILGNIRTGFPSDHKQSSLMKKVALRDVQNDNRSLIGNHPESSPVLGGRPIADAIKVAGTKRLTPERPLSPPPNPHLRRNGPNDHLLHAQRKVDSEPGKVSIQEKMDKAADRLQLNSKHSLTTSQELPHQLIPKRESDSYIASIVRPGHMAPMTFPFGAHIPVSLDKTGNGLSSVDSSCIKVNSEVCRSIDLKMSGDEQRKDRFLDLQKFLKQCDEYDNRDYIQMLLNMPPAELSRHAVGLETRAIQLTVEEGKQMQRMKALNILGKSGPGNNPLQGSQQSEAKK